VLLSNRPSLAALSEEVRCAHNYGGGPGYALLAYPALYADTGIMMFGLGDSSSRGISGPPRRPLLAPTGSAIATEADAPCQMKLDDSRVLRASTKANNVTNQSKIFTDLMRLMEAFKVPGTDVSATVEFGRKDMEALCQCFAGRPKESSGSRPTKAHGNVR
jgi:hypothetical protein